MYGMVYLKNSKKPHWYSNLYKTNLGNENHISITDDFGNVFPIDKDLNLVTRLPVKLEKGGVRLVCKEEYLQWDYISFLKRGNKLSLFDVPPEFIDEALKIYLTVCWEKPLVKYRNQHSDLNIHEKINNKSLFKKIFRLSKSISRLKKDKVHLSHSCIANLQEFRFVNGSLEIVTYIL